MMRTRAILWLLCVVAVNIANATPFSYQGRLLQAGVPANGRFDLRFGLFAGVSDLVPAAPIVTNLEVTVTGGIFTTILDFGTNAFTGSGSWLEIAVRPEGAPGDFVTLVPRQPITPAPFSIYT